MNFTKIGILLILSGISLLSACTLKPLIFSGESDNWRVHYEAKKGDKCQATSGYIKYIGDSPIPERVEYSIQYSMGSVPLEQNGSFTMPNGCTNASKDSEIEAIIK